MKESEIKSIADLIIKKTNNRRPRNINIDHYDHSCRYTLLDQKKDVICSHTIEDWLNFAEAHKPFRYLDEYFLGGVRLRYKRHREENAL